MTLRYNRINVIFTDGTTDFWEEATLADVLASIGNEINDECADYATRQIERFIFGQPLN